MGDSRGLNELTEVVRREGGRVLATLTRHLGSLDLAEDAVQDAVVKALEKWPTIGTPDNPAAWLTTTAKNAALDRIRRESRRRPKEELTMPPGTSWSDESLVADDLLRLLFTCCHPTLNREAQAALALRTLCGLTTAEIAAAFLVPEPTMAQRIVRAKRKIAGAGIPYRVPPDEDLPHRVEGVLTTIYLLFTEAHHSSTQPTAYRVDLADEAIYLGRTLHELLPDNNAVAGLLALMLATHARRQARVDEAGDLVLLADQDRTRWDRDAIGEADRILNNSLAGSLPHPYQLQAAIACVHGLSPSYRETDWQEIRLLYDRLIELQPTAVVAVNRAVAVAEDQGPAAGLAELERVHGVDKWHLYHSARAELLARLGLEEQARRSYRTALACEPGPADRRFIERRLERL